MAIQHRVFNQFKLFYIPSLDGPIIYGNNMELSLQKPYIIVQFERHIGICANKTPSKFQRYSGIPNISRTLVGNGIIDH